MKDNYDNPFLYSFFIDPLLKSAQKIIFNKISEKSSVIDIACGTGSFSFLLAGKCSNVTGVDIAPVMIDFALSKASGGKDGNIEFINNDILDLYKDITEPVFDYAVLSMAVHQFDEKSRDAVLKKANEIARKVFVLDYYYPVKPVFMRILINAIEYMAGKEHFRNFRSYNYEKGIVPILEKNKFLNIETCKTGKNIFSIVSFGKAGQ